MIDPDVTQIKEKTHRLIPSRFPPIHFLERVASAEDFDILYEIESLTNPRLRHEIGDISLVAEKDRIYGSGSSYIMAAFTHSKVDTAGGRFDRGFGVYYCARELNTAIQETRYHRAKFFRDFNSAPTTVDMRELVTDLHSDLHSIVDRQQDLSDIYHLHDYDAGQVFARELKYADSWGLQYSSVRCDGVCYSIFRPPALSNCRQSKHFEYFFDGNEISHVIEKREVK